MFFFRFAWLSLSLLDIGGTHFSLHPETSRKSVFCKFRKNVHLCSASDEFISFISFLAALCVILQKNRGKVEGLRYVDQGGTCENESMESSLRFLFFV